jgi:hypothetical protein
MMYEEEIDTLTEDDQAASTTRYCIDVGWYEKQGRSFRLLVESRLCPACRERIGTQVEERVPVVNAKGKVVYEARSVPFPANPIAQIRDCCSRAKGFIHPNLPLREVIFRILLANGNQPLDIEEIYQQLDWMGYGERTRFVSPALLRRLLENDDYYGIRSIPPAEEAPRQDPPQPD